MNDIQQRIAAVLTDHQGPIFQDGSGTIECYCRYSCTENAQAQPYLDDVWANHVAEVLVAELGLEPTYQTGWLGDSGILRVTPPMHGEAWPEQPAKRYVRWGTKRWEEA